MPHWVIRRAYHLLCSVSCTGCRGQSCDGVNFVVYLQAVLLCSLCDIICYPQKDIRRRSSWMRQHQANLTQGNLNLCVIKEIKCVLWHTAFTFCASWPKFWESNTLKHLLMEMLLTTPPDLLVGYPPQPQTSPHSASAEPRSSGLRYSKSTSPLNIFRKVTWHNDLDKYLKIWPERISALV